MKIEIINPLEFQNWDELLLTNPESTFFQSSAWARVLCETYRYTPYYFITRNDGHLNSLFPFIQVSSFFTGKRGVSLPFTDFCIPYSAEKELHLQTLDSLTEFAKRQRWQYYEIRGDSKHMDGSQPSAALISHSLGLSSSESDVIKGFRGSTRRNIKKAQKSGVEIVFENTWQGMKTFYDLHTVTRRHHGLPPQPLKFFYYIYKYIISKEKGNIALALYRNVPIAGGVFFHYHKKALFKFGASLRNYQHLRPNNLLMWDVISHYMKRDFISLSFGKTEPHNEGLLQFKRGWGARERTIHYYRYDLQKDDYIGQSNTIKSSYSFFKRTPLPLLKLAGNILYKHAG